MTDPAPNIIETLSDAVTRANVIANGDGALEEKTDAIVAVLNSVLDGVRVDRAQVLAELTRALGARDAARESQNGSQSLPGGS
jgi:hypothetical protein